MRHLIAVAAWLFVACAAQAVSDMPTAEIFVKARLMSLDRAPDCGIVLFGSPATYEVIAGPAELVGKRIHVMVDCAEAPRAGVASDHGDLKAFVVGATHFLALAKENIGGIENPSALPIEGIWFYLRAASLEELRPNSSFDTDTLRQGAASRAAEHTTCGASPQRAGQLQL